jgi:hypothetical protein
VIDFIFERGRFAESPKGKVLAFLGGWCSTDNNALGTFPTLGRFSNCRCVVSKATVAYDPAYNIVRSSFCFLVHPTDIFADNPQEKEIHTRKKCHHQDRRRKPLRGV